MIGRDEAVAAALRAASAASPQAAADPVRSVAHGTFDGRACWTVETEWATEPGDPDWMRMLDHPTTLYYVDAKTGACLAYRAGRTLHRVPGAFDASD